MADVQVAVVNFQTNTGTGNQTIAHATATFTAKLVRFFTAEKTTLGTDTGAINAVGCATASNEWSHACRSEDAKSSSNTARIQWSNKCISMIQISTASSFAEAEWVNFTLSGGKTAVTINWTDATGSAIEMFAVFYGGADLSVDAGVIALGNNTTAKDVTLSYDPDLVILSGANDNFNTTNGNPGNFGNHMKGYLVDPAGTAAQYSFAFTDQDNQATTDARAILSTNKCAIQVTAGSSTLDWYLTGGAHTTGTGFSVTPNTGTGNDDVAYIAFDFGGKNLHVGTYATPTSTGIDSKTDTGTDFDYLELFCTHLTGTTGTTNTGSALAGAFGHYMTDGTDEFSMRYATEWAVGTSNTERGLHDGSLVLTDDDGTSRFTATLSSLSAGWALNFSATDTGASRDWLYFGFGESTGGSTFNLTVTEALSLTEVSSETAAFAETVTESLVLADTSSETATFALALSESLAFNEASSEIATFPETLAEALALADTATSVATFARALAEALTFADTAEGSTAILKTAAESILLTDTSSAVATFARSVLDTIAFSDSAEIATKSIGATLVEALVLTDTADGALGAFAKEAIEALSLVDAASAQRAVAGILLETLNLVDSSATVNNTFGRTLASMLHFVDVAAAEGGVPEELGQRGGSSLSAAKQRRLERLQMLRRDDEEVINLIMGLFK